LIFVALTSTSKFQDHYRQNTSRCIHKVSQSFYWVFPLLSLAFTTQVPSELGDISIITYTADKLGQHLVIICEATVSNCIQDFASMAISAAQRFYPTM
jgi:hypothetical protein